MVSRLLQYFPERSIQVTSSMFSKNVMKNHDFVYDLLNITTTFHVLLFLHLHLLQLQCFTFVSSLMHMSVKNDFPFYVYHSIKQRGLCHRLNQSRTLQQTSHSHKHLTAAELASKLYLIYSGYTF